MSLPGHQDHSVPVFFWDPWKPYYIYSGFQCLFNVKMFAANESGICDGYAFFSRLYTHLTSTTMLSLLLASKGTVSYTTGYFSKMDLG